MKITLKPQYSNSMTTKRVGGIELIFNSAVVAVVNYHLFIKDFPELFNIEDEAAESLSKEPEFKKKK